MRFVLILVVLAIILFGGGVFYFANKANQSPPETGEQRLEVDLGL